MQAASACAPQSLDGHIVDGIRDIILGKHLTFRYMLVTALLAKNVDRRIHMRSLQAQANLQGAYDARSLCHSVLVPFEREFLESRLGGSNEPYLNKPARFPAIEKTNAVRAGKDQFLLNTLYDILESLNLSNPTVVHEALVYALVLTLTRDAKFANTVSVDEILCTQSRVNTIVNAILQVNSGGESAVIVTGAIFRSLYRGQVVVKVSPVNQAGSSSRGIGDIDLFYNTAPFCVIEVKDKPFTSFDVQHAIRVARESSVNRLIFMVGFSVPVEYWPPLDELAAREGQSGFDLSFASLQSFSCSMIAYFDQVQRQQMLSCIPQIVDEMRASDQTKRHIQTVLEEF